MPAGIRLFAPSSVVVAAIVVAATTAFVANQNVFACPALPPPTLRTLVLKSDRVIAATVGESLVIKTEKFEDGYNYAFKRTLLHVSATAKGDTHESTVYLYHEVWGEETPQAYGGLEEAKPILFFLKQRPQGDGYELLNITHGVKELPAADMKIYLRRIEELDSIMRQKKPDTREIVEWLVRCAEEPATRWDGAVELVMSEAMRIAAVEAENVIVHRAGGAVVVDSQKAEDDGASVGDSADAYEQEVMINSYLADTDVDATFAAQLTGEHKDRLAAALLNSQEFGEDEMLFVGLLQNWKDARLTPFLMTQLHKLTDNPPYFAEELVMVVARMLGDQTLIDLADDYSKRASYNHDSDDEEAVVESDGAESEATATAEAGGETAESGEGGEEQAVKVTDKQQRSKMLRRFIAHVENQAQPEAASLEARAN